jgi:hypothetical protein
MAAEFSKQEQLVDGTLNSLCSVFEENLKALKYTLTKNQTDFVPSFKFSSTLKAKTIQLNKKMSIARQT